MVNIKPFRALHPVGERAKEIACFPYDVAYESEAREFVLKNPGTFLRVTRPEIEFPDHRSQTNDEVLATGRSNLQALIETGHLVRDDAPAVYAYRLETPEHSQTGVVACCSLEDYENGLIKKHERTRPDKVAERTQHMVELRAQTGLILLAFKDTDEIGRMIAEAACGDPIFQFVDASGIKHTGWRFAGSQPMVDAFARLDALYIADGHHRIEAALIARDVIRERNGSGDKAHEFVMAGMFPAAELRILPYNRVVRNIEASDAEMYERIRENFVISEAKNVPPRDHGDICMYFRGRWHLLHFNVDYIREPDPIERLDVTILQKYLLAPVFGIGDPTTDERIGFVSGARGIEELERAVNAGEADAAFALYATRMSDLLAVSDMGEIMPPKSTWFDPKLKDGLFVHLI